MYCGAKRDAGGAPAAANSTIMGHPGMVEELKARADAARQQGGPAPDPGPPQGGYSGAPMQPVHDPGSQPVHRPAFVAAPTEPMAEPPGGPAHVPGHPAHPTAPQQYPGSGPNQGYPAPVQPHGYPGSGPNQGYPAPGQPQGYPGPGPNHGYAGPGHVGPPQGYPGPGPAGPPQGYPGPGPVGPPQGYPGPGPAGPPHGYPGPGPQAGYGDPGALAPGPMNREPAQPHRPPYLASETRDRMSAPVEPWVETLKTLMLVFGVLLVACFVAPWKVGGGQTVFSWTVLSAEAPLSIKMVPLLLAGTGVLGIVLGALPLGVTARGFAAAGIGAAPLLFLALSAKPFLWQAPALVLGTVALVAGLLIRSQYTSAMLGRLLATIGIALVVLVYLVPSHGKMPLLAILDQLADAPGKAKVIPIVGAARAGFLAGLVPLALAVAGLLVWLPSPGRAGAGIIAWLIIVWGLVASVVLLVVVGDIGSNLKGNLDGFIYLPLAGVAWLALVGYGIAAVSGKQLEHDG